MDAINPSYYKQSNLECIEAIGCFANTSDFCMGNVIKYLWRWKGKNGLEDLKKARWYLDKIIQEVENGASDVQDS